MRTESPVINLKELILFKCIPRKQAWDNVLSIIWGEKGGKPKFEGKSETFEKNWGKRIKLLHQEKVTCKQLGLGEYMVYVLNNAFAKVFYCSFILLSQCTNKVIDGFHAVIRSLNIIVSLLLVKVATSF